MQWSCSGLFFLPGSKKYSLNQEILLIFCNIPSKKIGNPTSPLLISASAQTISTPTENYLLSRLHREWRSLATSDVISSYSLSNSMHTFHIYCSFSDKPSIQTLLWLPVAILAVPAGENQKLCIGRCWKSLLKSPFFYTGNRSLCHLKEKWVQNSMT